MLDAARPRRAIPRGIGYLTLAIATLASSACSAPEPALRVGPVAFPESDLRGLGDEQRRLLTRITAVGLAVREGAPSRIGGDLRAGRLREARIQRLREEVALERAEVSERALEVHYASDPEWELTVRHLVVLSERWRPQAHRDDARRRAERALERVRAGEPFPEVAGEVSEEPGARERGGRLEPGRRGAWVDEFWNAAIRLDPGEISSVVETEYGFHVLQLDERRAVPFAEARDRVAAEVASRVADVESWETWAAEHGGEEALLAEAEARDIEVPASVRASIERDWERTVAGWAMIFGFEPDLPLDEVRARALDGLTQAGQNLRIAREEVTRAGPSIDGAYEVRSPEEG